MYDQQHIIDIYKAIYKLDGIVEPFMEFGPNHPKIGDRVNPDRYFSFNFTYKLDKIPTNKIPKEDALAATWLCTGSSYRNYHHNITFTSVEKINGRRRTVTFHDHYDLKCEIMDMPEKAKLIIEYKNGNYTLVELLKIFKEKNCSSRIHFKSIFLDMSGDDYLEVVEQLEKENTI